MYLGYRDLTPDETIEFQAYAKTNLPGRSDWSLFHPVLRAAWWELACRHYGIDPAGSFVVFSKANPYFQEGPAKTRYAVVEITAPVDYLTANDEESEEDGWEQIEKDLTAYLRGFNRFQDKSVPNAKFIEWEESNGV